MTPVTTLAPADFTQLYLSIGGSSRTNGPKAPAAIQTRPRLGCRVVAPRGEWGPARRAAGPCTIPERFNAISRGGCLGEYAPRVPRDDVGAGLWRTYSPVLAFGASTGFDSGEPFIRRKMDNTTRAPIDMNSLCQFWNDSNHSLDVVRYSSGDTADPP